MAGPFIPETNPDVQFTQRQQVSAEHCMRRKNQSWRNYSADGGGGTVI
jgi:hypothetical protein